SEIRHELERLERNGALQSKIEGLKSRLNDATNRRGMAPGAGAAAGAPQPTPQQPTNGQSRKDTFIGRLFARGARAAPFRSPKRERGTLLPSLTLRAPIALSRASPSWSASCRRA